MKHLNLTLLASLLSFISFAQAPAPITGPSTVCVGTSGTYTDATTGGTWSCGATAVASIDTSSGVLSGITVGTSTITYTTGGGSVTTVVTVSPFPAPIIGGGIAICTGSTITVTDITSGGVWSATGAAAIDPTGIVSGSGSGPATIYYTNVFGCSAVTTVTVNAGPFPYAMSGSGIACSGGAGIDISLVTGSTPGVTYQLFNGALPVGAPIAGTGLPLDFGLFAIGGTYTIVGTNAAGCTSTMTGSATITVAPSPTIYNVTGGGAICAGSAGVPVGLNNSDVGINYQLYNGAAAVGVPMSGIGASLSFGTITIAGVYSITAIDPLSSCTSNMSGTATIVVNPLPAVFTVSGGGSYCSGTSGLNILLSGSVVGISYQLFDGGVAASSPVAGTGAAISFGLHTAGTYTVVATNTSTGCTSNMTGSAVVIPVMLTPTVSIIATPGGSVCTGLPVTYGAAPVNGGTAPTYVWSVNGTAAGTGATHTYVPANGDAVKVELTSSLPCASPDTAVSTDSMVIITPMITASSSSACGGSDMLVAHGGVTYTWAPSTGLSCTTCDTVSVDPSSTITYTLTGIDVYGCIGTTNITADGNRISGHITIAGTPGSIRVWLIQYSSVDSSLTVIDSTMACLDSGTPYYAFNDKPAGNYLVKAQQFGGIPGTSGYIPTYGISSPHWDAATSVIHGSGTDTLHINMIYGIVPSGPGFISGYILSGAGKGTYTNSPVVGMLVYLTDAVSGNVLTYTYSNISGYYAFSGIANSSYIVFPELYHYYTTGDYVITLNALHDTVTSVDFKQHTQYGTITPYIIAAQVTPISLENGLNVYPNPTSGNLNIQWNNQPTENADIVVTDVVGREVYKSAIDINAASGQTQIDLANLKNGIYLINIRSANINYSGKLIIQQ